jgi:RNA polymerase sigma factor (sigma-70 family)
LTALGVVVMGNEGVPSWEEVARSYGRFLYTLAYRLTGNHADAQDLVQEVLLRVRKGLETYRPGSMEGWLSRITTNAFLDDARRRRRRPVELLPEEPDRVTPPAPSAETAFAAEVLPDDVQDALRRLPADYRSAVVLSDVVGLTYQEISDALRIPIGTVRSRLHRGRALLREALR